MSHTSQPAGTSHDDEEYYVVPVVPYAGGDYPEHNDSGFCADMAHECHENQDSITELNSAIQDGLITSNDADLIYRGKTVI